MDPKQQKGQQHQRPPKPQPPFPHKEISLAPKASQTKPGVQQLQSYSDTVV